MMMATLNQLRLELKLIADPGFKELYCLYQHTTRAPHIATTPIVWRRYSYNHYVAGAVSKGHLKDLCSLYRLSWLSTPRLVFYSTGFKTDSRCDRETRSILKKLYKEVKKNCH
jgi:hypothetical protein